MNTETIRLAKDDSGIVTLTLDDQAQSANTMRAQFVTDLAAVAAHLKAEGDALKGVIGDVRALGAMVAMELVKDGDPQAPDAALTKALVAEAARRGLVILACGVRGNVIRFLAPLTAEDAVIEEGMTIVRECLVDLVTRD